jgi:serine/threonine protein kinase
MTISSRTPEGLPNRCPVCGSEVRVAPSNPAGDAPCPQCGHLLWFVNQRLSNPPEGCNYSRIRLIGRNLGEVWAGEGPGGIPVAITIIPRLGDQEEVEGQQQTLAMAVRLHHPYLLRTLACWQLQDCLVIVTELAEGSLRDRLQVYRQAGLPGVPAGELLRYVRDTAEALDYLHGKHVIHGDIKPDHLFLVQGQAKVGHLELARLSQRIRLGRTGGFGGTPFYLAPEAWHGNVSKYTDQYALAMTYAELRRGVHPFEGRRSLLEVWFAHTGGVSDLAPMPAGEQAVVRKALAQDPGQRYGSCLAFVQELERVGVH